MKITKKKLQDIIKEEITNVLKEIDVSSDVAIPPPIDTKAAAEAFLDKKTDAEKKQFLATLVGVVTGTGFAAGNVGFYLSTLGLTGAAAATAVPLAVVGGLLVGGWIYYSKTKGAMARAGRRDFEKKLEEWFANPQQLLRDVPELKKDMKRRIRNAQNKERAARRGMNFKADDPNLEDLEGPFDVFMRAFGLLEPRQDKIKENLGRRKITKKKTQDIIEEEIKNIMAEDVAQEPVGGGGRNRRGAVGKEWLKKTVQKLSKLMNDLDGDYSGYLKQIEKRDVIITKSTLNHILNGIKKDISNSKSGIPPS